MQKKRATTLTIESIEQFRQWLFVKGKSSHTVKGYSTDLRMFLDNLDTTDGPRVVELGEEYDELGMAWLTQHRRVLAPRTTARRLTSLREFAKWAGYPDMLADYDAPDAGQPIPHPLPEGMNGVRRLIESTENERQRALVALCGFVGLRLAEALSVRYIDFTFTGNETWLTVRGKGDVTRTVPVSEECMSVLVMPIARAMGTREPIVPLKDRFARRCITELGQKAGLVRRIASHDLRATFATAVYDATKDQRLVQRLLGHSSGRTTEGYIGVAEDQMRKAVGLI